MRDSSVKTTSFHSATYILLSSRSWLRRRMWLCVTGRPSNGHLADRTLAVNGVEWFALTLNDALQTQWVVLWFVM
ncbi:hypothetical protein TNCV_1112661 [Trichonephila clavipes]|uniref:Uncharacterized protein n=1 Tax=Trichonephila clavipes TaxID=2585209 RepID=A0A8X6V406_TRICX|nr:hypothetical protein TNCV_1112661 [Trichonephila clavipes]